MDNKLPQNDPVGAYQRKTIAARRIGAGAHCACGESRPEALIAGSNPTICAKCDREKRGHTTMDGHHLGAQANNPLTVPVPVNDHRAELSVAQADWPKETRENPTGCPLFAAAGCIRGFIDWVVYIIKKGLLWTAEMLEALSKFLREKLGGQWWIGTPLEQFAPER